VCNLWSGGRFGRRLTRSFRRPGAAAAPLILVLAIAAQADTLPFLTDKELTALATEISGESAKRTVEGLSRQHRMRGSRGYHAAAEQVVAELKRAGLADAHIESLPADGKIFYGTQRSRPPWNADFAELWEVGANGERVTRLASWDAAPITLAQDSWSADVTAELIDVGSGAAEADYTNKDVKGKLVLASAQPGPVAAIAVQKLGAAGIVSYAQNQKTAWWGENENLIRWGHLETFVPFKTFAFMVSLKTARALQQRLAAGEHVRMHALVRAGQEAGAYEIATATIPGGELRGEEIVFSCHLDHPRPGANDNASGCATILEVARTLSKLIAEKRLEPPRRTIRFVFPPEIEGTLALLNGRPELAAKIKAAIHLDMVGGGPETKAIFHVTRGPASQPSFIYDIAQAAGELVNDQSARFASTGSARWPLVAPDGGKEALLAMMSPLSLGSDHQVYSDRSFGIPAIYLNDWPDRYIHTNLDVAANIDSTKLERAGFIAAACGYTLSRLTADDTPMLLQLMEPYALERRAAAMRRGGETPPDQPAGTPAFRSAAVPQTTTPLQFAEWYESEMRASVPRFFSGAAGSQPVVAGAYDVRSPTPKGPMSAFGYDYFTDHFGTKKLALNEEYRYEALNLADGRRSAQEIRDALSAIYEPVALKDVEEYLAALASIGVIRPSGSAP
jgi:aminopeptidase YwaD